MKKILIIVLILSLLLVNGCESSFEECKWTCYKVNEDMKERVYGNMGYSWLNITSELREKCYNECRGV